MTLSRYTNDADGVGRLNISLEDARTLKTLADAALEQDVREPELVAARAAPRVSITDAAPQPSPPLRRWVAALPSGRERRSAEVKSNE